MMPSWFDIYALPVGVSEPEEPAGISASVAAVHGLLDGLVKSGVPSQSILLGGFSQGGALSLQAGLTYPSRLAGIVCISGWLVTPKALDASPHARDVPTFFSSGTADPVVDYRLAQASGQLLRELFAEGPADRLCLMRIDRAAHHPKKIEQDAAVEFMLNCLQ